MTPCISPSLRCIRAGALALLVLGTGLRLGAQPAGALQGRVTNPATGLVLEGARITVEGTNLATSTDEDGYYQIENIPAGAIHVQAFFTGFPSATAVVNVTAGQTATRDFQLAPLTVGRSEPEDATIKLDEYVVATSREMSASALAINEQRFASNMKNVVATDQFGDIAEGNVAEFVKFIPGVNVDNAGGNAREISLNGVPWNYVPVTIGGFGVASAVGGGAGGTSRGIGLDQVSINNLSRIEVAFSPTPDSQANALAGSVNLIPRSSFERTRPAFNFSSYFMMRGDMRQWGKTPAPLHPTRKIKPGMDVSYINPLTKNFGFTLSAGFNAQYSGEPQLRNTWRGTNAATNGNAFPDTSFDQPYLTSVLVRNSGKDTHRKSLGVTVDYRLSHSDRISLSLQYSTFEVQTNHNALTFDVGRVTPGNFALDFTRGSSGQGSLQLETNASTRANWTVMPTIIWRHDGPIWKMDSGFGYSRAGNRSRSTESGYFDTTTARRTNVTVAFSGINYLRPATITVTDPTGNPVNPYSLANYSLTGADGNTRSTDDYKRTTYANVRRDFFGVVPLSLRSGLDFRQSSRDQRFSAPTYTFVGADGVGSTIPTATTDDQALPFLDPVFSGRQPHYGYPKFQGVDAALVYSDFVANPAHFTSKPNTTYRNAVTNSKYARELISAWYVRGDLAFLKNRLKIVTGLRAEQTNIAAQGPLTDPSRNNQLDAKGNPILGPNGKPLTIVPTSDALGVSKLTYIERGARSKKEYLRWFPSVNASYNVRENLIARAAWYTSIGRPDYNQYAGGVTLPDPDNPSPTDQITVSNVGIKPWTARTFNARLEYYPAGVGQLSIGVFRRDFSNFFGSTTLQATPEFLELYSIDPTIYGSYPIVTQYNLDSSVRMQGVNASYQQALTFLPKWARGFQVFANINAQRLLGPSASNFPGFIPRTYNWGVSLNRQRYTLRMNWNYRGLQRRAAIAAGNSIEPGTYTWASKRLYLDVNGEYYFWKRIGVFLSIRNINNEPEDTKVFGPSTPKVARFRERIEYGSLWSFGIKGTF